MKNSTSTTSQAAPNQSGTIQTDTGEYIDLGYVSVPVHFADSTQTVTSETSYFDNLEIASLKVDVKVPNELDQKYIKDVTNIVRSQVANLNPKVNVTRVEFPKFTVSRDIASTAKDEIKSDTVANSEPLLQKWDIIVKIFLVLTFIAAIIVAVRIFSSSLRSGFEVIASGLQTLRPSTDKPLGLEIYQKEEQNKTDSTIEHEIPIEDHQKNLNMVKDILKESPLDILRSLTNSQNDILGIRWLLTKLMDDEKNTLKQFLSTEQLESMETIPPSSAWKAAYWLQQLVEKVTVRQMKGKSELEIALTVEQMISLYSLDHSLIKKLVISLNHKGAWRLATEVLSKKEFQQILTQANENDWEIAMSCSEASEQEIKEGYEKLYQATKSEKSQSKEDQVSDSFFIGNILPTFIEAIKDKPIGEDQKYLAKLSINYPSRVKEINKFIWTFDNLTTVAEDQLKMIINSLEVNQLFALMVSLPNPWPEKFQAYLPDNRKKVIILDLIERSKKNPDEKGLFAARKTTRDFIESLRRMHLDGKLKMKSEAKSA